MNSNLPDHVDRLSQLAKSIRTNAQATMPTTGGPFTEAVLRTPLGDLIRDIDPTELGLFTLVAPTKPVISDPDVPLPMDGGLARVEFHGATPLKKPPAPKLGRPEGQRTGEHEPEVYARAAVKYLDRYQSIRPMPRASEQAERIIEQLGKVRDSIRALSEQLKQHTASDPPAAPSSPKSIIKDEGQRIMAAQSQIAELRKRKEALIRQKSGPRLPRIKPKPKPRTPPHVPDEQEETFWNTPGAAARTLHFTGDSLLDEEVHIADTSNLSFASPVSTRSTAPATSIEDPPEEPPEDDAQADETIRDCADESLAAEEEESVDDKEPTMKLVTEHTASTSPERLQPMKPPIDTPKRVKVKVTTELEQIVSKIWSTIGEQIKSGHGNGSKSLRAKETLVILADLSNSAPTPSSPSTSHSSTAAPVLTASTQPSAQQILTAHMLLTLLSAPPTYSMSLGRLKEALSTKSASLGVRASMVGGAGITRPVYGCVAKRLLKIERGSGEQVVKFDV